MRIVKTMSDVQKALNELFDWKQKMQSTNWDISGRRIINAGSSQAPTDYVIKAELQSAIAGSVNVPTVFYTATFNPPDGVATGAISPPFVIGRGRGGNATQAWVAATGASTTTPITCNFQYNGVNILSTDLSLPIGQTAMVESAAFVIPTQLMAQGGSLTMIMTSANTATGVTGGVVIQITPNATTPSGVQ
jgi:hypothetical protein